MSDVILIIGQCCLFHDPAIFRHISYSVSWIRIILGLMAKADTSSDLSLIVGQCYLHFMVQ